MNMHPASPINAPQGMSGKGGPLKFKLFAGCCIDYTWELYDVRYY